ncbi:MAG: hypothetical protein J5819_00380 [Eubacterium sp.]|nr:hypothetical protein [Eubacterium sp.]
MRKRIMSTFLTLVLLAALIMPVTISDAAGPSFENGVYGATVGDGVWLIDLKKSGSNKVEIGIAWSDASSAFGTVKPFKKKIKSTIKFSVTGNYLNPDKTVSDKTLTISGSIKLKGKKLKCKINGESFTANYAP